MLSAATVGRASRASGWTWSRNGFSFFATGFDAFTSGSTWSSVLRTFTKVVLAWRMKSGRRPMASASEAFWAPIACVVALRLATSAERSSRFWATAVTRCALSPRKCSSTGVSRFSSLNRRLEVDSAGFR